MLAWLCALGSALPPAPYGFADGSRWPRSGFAAGLDVEPTLGMILCSAKNDAIVPHHQPAANQQEAVLSHVSRLLVRVDPSYLLPGVHRGARSAWVRMAAWCDATKSGGSCSAANVRLHAVHLQRGDSPVPVSARAPGSRPQARESAPVAQAGCRKPLRREQTRGPHHEVKPAAKPAASSDSYWGSRATHVTAKAMSVAPRPERAAGSPGVRGAVRVHGDVRNTPLAPLRDGGRSSTSWLPRRGAARISGARRPAWGDRRAPGPTRHRARHRFLRGPRV